MWYNQLYHVAQLLHHVVLEIMCFACCWRSPRALVSGGTFTSEESEKPYKYIYCRGSCYASFVWLIIQPVQVLVLFPDRCFVLLGGGRKRIWLTGFMGGMVERLY